MITSNVHANVLANARVDSGVPDWALRSGVVSPVVDLIFTASRYWLLGGPNPPTVPGFITATRAAAKYAPWADGHLSSFASNAAAITDLGLSVEQASTNLVLQSQAFANAAWTKNAAVTATDNFAVAPDGTTTASRLVYAGGSGSPDSRGVQRVGINISGGTGSKIITAAFWLKSNTGSSQTVRLKNTQGGVVDTFSAKTVTTTWQRFSFTVTNSASAGDGTQIPGVYAAAADTAFDILVWQGDLENNAFATSDILTTSAAATRAIDNLAAAGALLTALQAARGTVIISLNSGIAATVGTILGINSLIGLGKTAADKLTTAFGGAQTTANSATWTGNVKVGLRWTPTSVSIVLNGGTIVTAANVPPTVTAAYIGTTSGASAAVNQPIKRLTAYAVDVTDAAFQALTT